MTGSVVALFVAFLFLVPITTLAAPTIHAYHAELSGLNEVPPNGSPALGVAHVVIDTAANTLQYHVSYAGLTGAETAAHVHGMAPVGANGGVLHGLPTGQPKVGAWTFMEAQEADILAGLTYVNIHSNVFPGGEIRGQIVPNPATELIAIMEGTQEVPPVASTGLGIGFFEVDVVTDMLSFDLRHAGLVGTETAAHIHGFAPAGSNAGVLFGLPLGSPKIGSWNYLASQESALLSDLAYVNIHTNFSPGGEIRGQIINVSGPLDVLPTGADGPVVRAFPNPVRGGSTALFYRARSETAVEIDVIDVQGRVVRHLHRAPGGGEGSLTWDTRDDAGQPVATGVYFVRATLGGEPHVGRLVVLR